MTAATNERNALYGRIQTMIERLADEFRGMFSEETIARTAYESLESLRDAAVVEYVPGLVYRFTRERLSARAKVGGMVTKEQPEILFVCIHNAGRSQMAAVFARELSAGRVLVRSAGSAPANEINPVVRTAMAEVGMDLSQEFPKPLVDEVVEASDVVITMGCGDACPVFPGKRYLDWELRDPAGQPIEVVREIRDEIRGRVERLLQEMGVPTDRES